MAKHKEEILMYGCYVYAQKAVQKSQVKKKENEKVMLFGLNYIYSLTAQLSLHFLHFVYR